MRVGAARLTFVVLATTVTVRPLGLLGQTPAAPAGTIETVATFDSTGATENICEKPDGSIYVTGMDDRVVWKIDRKGALQKFASIPSVAAVVGLAPTGDGIVVTAALRAFRRPGQTPAVDFSDVGPEVLVLDRTGKVAATIAGEKGQFFNGITALGGQKYLIADTNAATVWQVDVQKKRLEVWLKDPLIDGANGIKVHNGSVYLSTRGGLKRVEMDASGRPKGAPIVVAQMARADDFDIAKDGTIYFPSGTTIMRVSPAGEVSTFRPEVQGGPAALVSRDGKWLYWPTRGGTAAQRLLRTPIP